jgi:hypothetical protein
MLGIVDPAFATVAVTVTGPASAKLSAAASTTRVIRTRVASTTNEQGVHGDPAMPLLVRRPWRNARS